jgi:bacterioferritin (cytochrome b1)
MAGTPVTLPQIITLLEQDLRNEWKHMNFYLYHASAITGLHAEEYKEVFLKEAASEMQHVTEFSNMLWGLGGKPDVYAHDFPRFTDVREALQYAYTMEQEVVRNYAERLNQLLDVTVEPEATWLTVFLEDQLAHSRADVDRFKRLLA